MAKCFMSLFLIAGLFALPDAGRAQDSSAPKTKRSFYVLKHANARDLAEILGKHFKGEADIQALADSPSNLLLINAAPDLHPEVVKLVEQLDQRPQLVAVDLLIAEVAPRKGEPGQELNDKDFTGPSKEVLDRVEGLRKKGIITGLKRVQLAALENQTASMSIGEQKPVVVGANFSARGGAGGFAQRNITYHNTGTTVKVTARVAADKLVTMNLTISESWLRSLEEGVPLGKEENGSPIVATEVANSELKTTLTVLSGQALAAEGVKNDSKSGLAQTFVIVAARILEPAARGNK